jgi:hypothetical protein
VKTLPTALDEVRHLPSELKIATSNLNDQIDTAILDRAAIYQEIWAAFA